MGILERLKEERKLYEGMSGQSQTAYNKSMELSGIISYIEKLEKFKEFAQQISDQGWWSTKMTSKQYSGILDDYKKLADEYLKI